MKTISLWNAISQRKINYPELIHDLEVDVAIIGGGITGITAANQLTNAGKKVAVLDSSLIGGVTTSHSTGNLYLSVQPMYQSIASKFNITTARAVALSRQFAIDYIESNVQEKNINCHFNRRPWFIYTAKNEVNKLEKEVETYKQMEIAIDYTKELPLHLNFKLAALMPNQARFNPLQYVISMAEDLSEKGCAIFENTHVFNIEEKKSYCVITTEQAKIRAEKVIVATHIPIGVNWASLYTAPYRSYVIAASLPGNHYPEGHFWCLDQPTHTISTHSVSEETPQILLISGNHHKTGQGQDMMKNYHKVAEFIESNIPLTDIVYQWSAQHYQAADNMPYIGLVNRSAKRTYMATGYFADGLTYGTLAGIIISDMILNRQNPFIELYQSTRHDFFSSIGFLAKENLNVLLQYLKDFPLFSKDNFDDLKRGEGKVVEMDNEKWAVSKDADNKVHIVSAVCPHMKCIVNWNNAEQTWDCPCHGSRFTHEGCLIEGPATCNLAKKY